ncbi:MAG: GFA family protein [Allosphingosinicella sp.]
MDEWKLPWDGGCRCGEVRIRVSRPPLITGACHCTGCQSMSASAFSLSVGLPSDGFEIVSGEPVPGGLRRDMHFFCPACLTWMFTRPPGMDGFVNLRASTLDEHRWVVPYMETWTREKLSWASTPARRSYETVPDESEYEPLIRAFAAEGARP